MYISQILLAFIFIVGFNKVFASDFFSNTQVNKFKLTVPFSEMLNFKKSGISFLQLKEKKFDGVISYLNADGKNVDVEVKINIKGFSSAQICNFPKLELKIKNVNKNSIFGGIEKIDLNTHCDESESSLINSNGYSFYQSMYNAHREVVVYGIQQVLGLKYLKTKAVSLEYVDLLTNQHPLHAYKPIYQAFFVEDKSEFISRNNYLEIKSTADPFKDYDLLKNKYKAEQYAFLNVHENLNFFNILDLVKTEFLQNLVGNSDWFIKSSKDDFRSVDDKNSLWNVKIFQTTSNHWFPLAQDFNLSMLSWIEVASDYSFRMQADCKYFKLLNANEKAQFIENLIVLRPVIMSKLDLIKSDYQYEKISKYLNLRFDYLIQEMTR